MVPFSTFDAALFFVVATVRNFAKRLAFSILIILKPVSGNRFKKKWLLVQIQPPKVYMYVYNKKTPSIVQSFSGYNARCIKP